MTGFVAIAAIAFVGLVAAVGWVVCVSLGIRRDDRRSLRVGAQAGAASRVARQSTGLHSA